MCVEFGCYAIHPNYRHVSTPENHDANFVIIGDTTLSFSDCGDLYNYSDLTLSQASQPMAAHLSNESCIAID